MSNAPVLKSKEKLIEVFKQQGYDEPIIGGGEVTQIPGLGFYSVYDKSQEAEDPLIPARYVVTSTGKAYSAWEIAKAVKTLDLVPKSAQEALTIATVMVEIANDGAWVIKDLTKLKPVKKQHPSDITTEMVKTPQVSTKEGYYEIVLYTFTPEEILPFMNFKTHDDYYARHRVKLGKGVCELN